MTFATKMGGSIVTGIALAGCVAAEMGGSAPPLDDRAAEAAQALTGWQCSCSAASEYIVSVSLSQGTALGCASGAAYRCESIPWCTRGSFTQCSESLECPPGWHASGRRSGPSYCNGIMDSTSCSAVPYPGGTYATCDASCALGFTQTSVAPDTPSCDYGTKITCQK